MLNDFTAAPSHGEGGEHRVPGEMTVRRCPLYVRMSSLGLLGVGQSFDAPRLFILLSSRGPFLHPSRVPCPLSPSFPREHITSFREFCDGSYPPDVIVWGWNNARGTVPK